MFRLRGFLLSRFSFLVRQLVIGLTRSGRQGRLRCGPFYTRRKNKNKGNLKRVLHAQCRDGLCTAVGADAAGPDGGLRAALAVFPIGMIVGGQGVE